MPTPVTTVPPEVAPTGIEKLFRRWKSFGASFLFLSIALHLLFGVGATALIVQRIQAKRQLAFQGGPPAPSRSQRSVEHKVQVAKQKQTSSAPAPPRRIAVTGLAKVSLPELPTVPTNTASTLAASKLGSMGGTSGFGLGPGTLGAGAPGGGSGGGGTPMFGLHENTGSALRGVFYDLKQTAGRQPTNMNPEQYGKVLADFVRGGWSEGLLARFYKAPRPLYTPQIFIPDINANDGPAAFGVEREVQPRLWAVLYKGVVTPSESGTFHFVGAGDDILFVRWNNKLVLERCWDLTTGWHPVADYDYGYSKIPHGFAKGDAIQVEAGKTYPMEVLIGEQPGGRCFFSLLIEKEGGDYRKDGRGNPLLPVFRLADVKPSGQNLPPHAEGGPVWRASPTAVAPPTLLDQIRGR